MNVPALFWKASQEELKNGYVKHGDCYICLLCGRKVEKRENDLYAEQSMRVHVDKMHGSEFEYLAHLEKVAQVVKCFEPGRSYTEKEVNEIIKTVENDFVTLRRYLIELGFMERKPDGSQYWLK